MKTKAFLIIVAIFIYGININAQLFSGSKLVIGVDEQLGDTLPLDLTFLNENGEKVALKELINKPTIFSFVYFNCPGMCSPLQQGVSELIDNSDLVIGEDYQSITISFDYNDNPQMASKKKKNFAQCISKEKCENWYYLTADSSTINKMLHSVGYKVKIMGLDFAHPSGIVVVSPKGVITRYLYGVDFLPFDFKMSIVEAQKGLPRPSINRVLDFCFAYDPTGQTYTLQITKISATVIIFFAVVLFISLMLKSRRKRKQVAANGN